MEGQTQTGIGVTVKTRVGGHLVRPVRLAPPAVPAIQVGHQGDAQAPPVVAVRAQTHLLDHPMPVDVVLRVVRPVQADQFGNPEL